MAFEGGSAQGQETELLEDRFIPGFATGIAGMQAGETKDVAATFPDPYANPDLAGKDAVFTITVHDRLENMEQRQALTDNVLLRASLRLAEQVRRSGRYEVVPSEDPRNFDPMTTSPSPCG